MFKDIMRLTGVMLFDGAGYCHDILAQRLEMAIAIYGAHSLLPIF